jgi:DNA ligase 4
MPFQFGALCELVDALELSRSKLPSSNSRCINDVGTIIRGWFDKYSQNIPRQGREAVAFLSCLFPERRADRVYELKESRLEEIIKTAIGISRTRMKELGNWRHEDGPDFATAVQRVLSAAEICSTACPSLTLVEIDQALDWIASRSRFSSDHIRQKTRAAGAGPSCVQEELSKIFRRLHSSHAKWFVRVLLKTYDPVDIPEDLTLRCHHFLLPPLLRIQNSFEAAIQYLGGETIKKIPFRPAKDVEMLLTASAFHDIKPQIGVMVAQPSRKKARSIQHCGQLAGAKRVSVERKYDGEYCQIHIDLQKKIGRTIRIFSKSGRDSIDDRIGLHNTINECLAIGTLQCEFKRHCILEGELLVWNNDSGQIEPFYKIRRHVKRSGRFLGCAQGSPAPVHEKLMIIFYDLLLLDDIVCFQETHDKRRQRLWSTVQSIPGRAEIGSREKIQFGSEHSLHSLHRLFAQAISELGGSGAKRLQ